MTMRRTVIAGNWKMYKGLSEGVELVTVLKARLSNLKENMTVVICPPFTSLATIANLTKDSALRLGAQNMSQHDEGAYTGEISWKMLKSVSCEYVILGHSERRQYFGETNELVNLKAVKALSNGLIPIICVGEKLEEREAGTTDQIITTQVRGVLRGLSEADMERVIIAYEPVWAIGTGKNATPQQAQEVHVLIRKLVGRQFNSRIAERIVIQYGGSVKPDNAPGLLAQDDIDGALVGGACLQVDSFAAIVAAAKA
jgi:triosephosphate isomerase